MKFIKFETLKKVIQESSNDKKLKDAVAKIIEKVKKEGDKALFRLTEKFDRVKLKNLKVNQKKLEEAMRKISREEEKVIEKTSERIEKYHRKQMPSGFTHTEKDLRIKFTFSPVESAGIYIPGGQAPLVSTVLMSVIPAKVAGVKKILVCSPPSFHDGIHPYILAVLYKLGIKDIFTIGGAQAIAAFAYGTGTIPKVDKIAGPGNKYVNTAKKLISGETGIDLLAGPSEVVIFSDSTGKEEFIVSDLKSQMEHTDGFGILITTSKKLGERVSKKTKGGYWLLVKNKNEAVEIINFIAPEHLQIICEKRENLLDRVTAGAVFIGNYTPTVLGDYFAGPSHILPTGRTSRFSSGLSVYTFLRSYAVIEAKESFLKKDGKTIQILSNLEGLKAHSSSIEKRMK